MLTKKVKNRILLLILIATLSLLSIFFIIKNLNKNILYFMTPTEIKNTQDIKFNKSMRIGGMVKKDSLVLSKDEIKFTITDFNNEILVSFTGSVPNLFMEEKGVIAEGMLRDKKYFLAKRILAKHDENYMPPELKNVLKENVK